MSTCKQILHASVNKKLHITKKSSNHVRIEAFSGAFSPLLQLFAVKSGRQDTQYNSDAYGRCKYMHM